MKFTDEELRAAITGNSVSEAARILKAPYSSVYARAIKMGLIQAGKVRDGVACIPKKKFTDEELKLALKGRTQYEAAAILGVSFTTVNRRMKEVREREVQQKDLQQENKDTNPASPTVDEKLIILANMQTQMLVAMRDITQQLVRITNLVEEALKREK